MLNVCLPFFFYLQQVVELEGYVIILVEGRDGKIKLYGSPADRDGLEVADEILDVNERKLDDVPRALVIKHIHEVTLIKLWWVWKAFWWESAGKISVTAKVQLRKWDDSRQRREKNDFKTLRKYFETLKGSKR